MTIHGDEEASPSGGKAQERAARAAEAIAELNAAIAAMEEEHRTHDENEAIRQTLTLLVGLVRGLARVPGRKTVVLLSNGFALGLMPADRPVAGWEVVRQIVGEAGRAGVRFDAIDARGLDRGHASSTHLMTPEAPVPIGQAPPVSAEPTEQDVLSMLSADTGGLFIHNENSFDRAFREVAADAASYYVLGYRPTNTILDGTYRKITVRVKKPRLRVRARQGYLATPPAAAAVSESGVAKAEPAASGVVVPSPARGVSAPTTLALLPLTPVEPAPIVLPVPRADAAGATPDDPSAIRLRTDTGTPTDVTALGRGRAAEGFPSLGGLPEGLAAGARVGWAAYERGDTKAARDALSPVAGRPGAPPWTSYVLGWADFAEGEFEDATGAWERVRAAVPEFEPVYFDLADGYLQQHQGAVTLDVLHDAAGRWPQDVEVLNAIGVVQTSLGRLADAVATFGRATALAPEDAGAGFNLARACELDYVGAIGRHETPQPGDLERAAAEYRRVAAMEGPLAEPASEGLRRVRVLDARALKISKPQVSAQLTQDELRGDPQVLAWSPDGNQLYVEAGTTGHTGQVATTARWIVSLSDGRAIEVQAEPAWARTYWRWKAAQTAPWLPERRIRLEMRKEQALRQIPDRGDVLGAPPQYPVSLRGVLLLDDQIVGSAVNTLVVPGATFGWAPYAMGAIAFSDNGRLAILDAHGHKVRVDHTRDVLVPSWSDNGRRIAWLEREGKTYVLKMVDVSGG